MEAPMKLDAVSNKHSNKLRKVLMESMAILLMELVLSPFVVVVFNAS